MTAFRGGHLTFWVGIAVASSYNRNVDVSVERSRGRAGGASGQPIRVDARGPRERAWTVVTVVVAVVAVLLIWIVTFTPTWAGSVTPTTEIPVVRGDPAR
jgi:hypothetical protein